MAMDLMKTLNVMVDAINPEKYKKVIENQKGKGKFLWDSVIIISMVCLVLAVVNIIVGLVATIFGGFFQPVNLIFGLGTILLSWIGSFIFLIISFIIAQYIFFYLAQALGGKGTIDNQAYTLALIDGGMGLVMVVVSLFNIIPCAGPFISAIGVLGASIWALYLHFVVLKGIHGLTDTNAILVLFGWLVITVVIVGILSTILWVVFTFLGIATAIGGIVGSGALS